MPLFAETTVFINEFCKYIPFKTIFLFVKVFFSFLLFLFYQFSFVYIFTSVHLIFIYFCPSFLHLPIFNICLCIALIYSLCFLLLIFTRFLINFSKRYIHSFVLLFSFFCFGYSIYLIAYTIYLFIALFTYLSIFRANKNHVHIHIFLFYTYFNIFLFIH